MDKTVVAGRRNWLPIPSLVAAAIAAAEQAGATVLDGHLVLRGVSGAVHAARDGEAVGGRGGGEAVGGEARRGCAKKGKKRDLSHLHGDSNAGPSPGSYARLARDRKETIYPLIYGGKGSLPGVGGGSVLHFLSAKVAGPREDGEC